MPRKYSAILSSTHDWFIGANNQLPWSLSQDLKFFRKVTSQFGQKTLNEKNAVIMGRKTWESIPEHFRPLKNRKNIVISSKPVHNLCGDAVQAYSFSEAMSLAETGRVFVIGGTSLYDQAFKDPNCQTIFHTRVSLPKSHPNHSKLDAQISELPTDFSPVYISRTHSEDSIPFDFVLYQRRNPESDPCGDAETQELFRLFPSFRESAHDEFEYLNLVRKIIEKGQFREDRTNVGTVGLFGEMLKFDIQNSFPLLTTKRVYWKGVLEELLWFIRGSTNSNELKAKGVRIWDGNGSREFLDQLGFKEREEGDLGPVYGFQWRHFGAKYTDMHGDYSGQGVDQLSQLVEGIKRNPYSRRHIMSAWNPLDLGLMALPPW